MSAAWQRIRQRWGLPLALWVVFGLTLALAAILRLHQRETYRIRLEPASALGELELSRPAGWSEKRREDWIAWEDPRGRRVEVHIGRTSSFVSPLDYLGRSGILGGPEGWNTPASATRAPAARPLRIAGWPGILITQTVLVGRENVRSTAARKRLAGCAILPGGRAIVIALEAEGMPEAADEQLVSVIAAAMSLRETAAPRHEPAIELADGIALRLPPGLVTGPETDHHRTARILLQPNAPSAWLGIEVAPCMVLPGNEAESFAAMFLLRDRRVQPGQVRALDPRTLLCSARNPDGRNVLAVLHRNADGRALLAEFRWVSWTNKPADELNQVLSLWKTIAPGVEFTDGPGVTQRAQAGMAAIGRLPRNAAELLENRDVEERWQWYDQSEPRQSLTEIRYSVDPEWIEAMQMTDGWPPPGPGGREMTQWRLRRDWKAYEYAMAWVGPTGGVTQKTVIQSGKITTTVREGRKTVRGAGAIPPLFVPGAMLPRIMEALPFEPILLQAESVISATPAHGAGLLTLLLEPAFDAPKTLAGGKEPMRCWKVRISGTSDASHWYLDPAGRLHSIDFAGGIHLVRAKPDDVEDVADLPEPNTQPATSPAEVP